MAVSIIGRVGALLSGDANELDRLEAAFMEMDCPYQATRTRQLADLAVSASTVSPMPPTVAGPVASFGLTDREIEVLTLVAAGSSNPQIAAALYISRKTAEHHVSHILAKLGVTTRSEAAALAGRSGLGIR